jgi:hypothetical protein
LQQGIGMRIGLGQPGAHVFLSQVRDVHQVPIL